MKFSSIFSGVISAVVFMGLVVTDGEAKGRKHQKTVKAQAKIVGCNDPDIKGRAFLKERRTEEGIKQVEVSVFVRGLEDGKHAVHIHEVASCQPCGSAKGHHDPGAIALYRDDSNPNAPDQPHFNHPFHMGDLINIEVRNGKGAMHTTTNRVTLSDGRLSIFDEGENPGSAIIIHTNEDTYCDQEDELAGGCAGGSRDACGIIEPIRQLSR